MVLPLKINNTNPKSLKEMNGSEMNYAAFRILEEFVTSDINTGNLAVGSTPTGAVSIGSFVDTRRDQAVGTHPAGTNILTSTTNFYQRTATESESSAVRPVEYDSGVREMDNSNLHDTIITNALNMLKSAATGYGLGSYKLQPNNPGNGTWGQQAIIFNRVVNAQGNFDENQTVLWKKKTQNINPSTSIPTVRPIKVRSNDNMLQEMSDTEIKTLVNIFRNRIISSGIGTYKIQTSAPTTGGTWTRQGSAFTDTRRQRQNANYSGTYTGYYAGNRTYSANYAGSYTGSYQGNFAGSYAGTYARFFSGRFGGNFTGYYTGYYANFFSGSYTGYYAGSRTYSANYAGSYTGSYTGATILSSTEDISNVSLWLRTA